VPTTQLFPQVIDASTLGAKLTSPIFFPIGLEGQGAAAGSGVAGQVYTISTPSEADTILGPTARVAQIAKFLLTRGAAPLKVGVAQKTGVPTLAERQVIWDAMASDPTIRLRLTDSIVQSDLVAFGTNLTQADAIFNKQFGIVGMATGTTKALLITAAAAIANKRVVLVGPGVYDESSPAVLRDGCFLAAGVAAEVAKNGDPTNDLDRWPLPLLTGIEKDVNNYNLLRVKTVGGVATNDFEDLLQGGVSPVMPDSAGGVLITHLRTTYTTDGTFDSLQTRIIVDQVFVDVRDYLTNNGFLRQPNTPDVRGRIQSGVEALLLERRSWIKPKAQNDGTSGYNVQVTSSLDNRQITVAYEGTVVRGISTIQVAASLDIPV
jgi:hypothetical protein